MYITGTVCLATLLLRCLRLPLLLNMKKNIYKLCQEIKLGGMDSKNDGSRAEAIHQRLQNRESETGTLLENQISL